jgi:RHS repeat-associated protein
MIQELDAAQKIVKGYHWGLDVSHTFEGAGTLGGLYAIVDNTGVGTTGESWLSYPAYDGNRLKTADSLTLPATNNYSANSLNQYTAVGAINPAYDTDGNATAYPLPANPGANSTLTWDAENRLTAATVNGVTTTYKYDAQSRRIATTIAGASTLTIYDGWNPIAQYGSADLQSASLTKTYLWGMDLSGTLQGAGGVGGLLSVTGVNGTHHPTFDGNGNISEYLDPTGTLAAHYEYDPFGTTTVATGPKAAAFTHRFSTKPLDPETGLYYYGYRFYDPKTGRWPSRDPIGELGGNNLYGFGINSPLNGYDDLGDSWSGSGSDSGKPSTWKLLLKAAKEVHDNYDTYKKMTDAAKQTFRTQIDPNYDCCWKGKWGYKVSDWDVPDNPNIGFQVLHRQMGCELKNAGASQEAMALLNVLYETKTSIYEILAKLKLSPKSGVDDWIWDTARDMSAVLEGWSNGGSDCATKFIPSECKKKSGK